MTTLSTGTVDDIKCPPRGGVTPTVVQGQFDKGYLGTLYKSS